jgi:hypothetical protein
MGGGGDGGYGARQDKMDADKAAARARLNELFGITPTAAPGASVSRDRFNIDASGNGYNGEVMGGFDQVGYDAAVAAAGGDKIDPTTANANKSALDKLYGNTRTDAYTAGKRRVDEQKQQAGRDLKFELFARGQNGGSVDIDQNALLGRTYSQGLTDLGAKADATATGLRSANEQARLGLLQSIDSGMDQGSAVSSALGQMRVNSDKAAADATGTALGDLFANAGLIYERNRVSQGVQNAQNAWRTGGAGYMPRGSSGSLTATG